MPPVKLSDADKPLLWVAGIVVTMALLGATWVHADLRDFRDKNALQDVEIATLKTKLDTLLQGQAELKQLLMEQQKFLKEKK